VPLKSVCFEVGVFLHVAEWPQIVRRLRRNFGIALRLTLRTFALALCPSNSLGGSWPQGVLGTSDIAHTLQAAAPAKTHQAAERVICTPGER